MRSIYAILQVKEVLVECELAWSAGFFDGEGTVYNRTRFKKYTYLNLEISQRDRRPLDRFCKAVGHGKIISRPSRGSTKEHFMWVCYRQQDVKEVMNKIYPYLSDPKKEQYKKAKGDISGV